MTTATHTPTPWRFNAIKGNRIVGDSTITDAEKWHVNGANCTVATFYRQRDAAYANAIFNAHDKLVAALRLLTTEYSDQDMRDARALLAELDKGQA